LIGVLDEFLTMFIVSGMSFPYETSYWKLVFGLETNPESEFEKNWENCQKGVSGSD
jgi:hypothetical protein